MGTSPHFLRGMRWLAMNWKPQGNHAFLRRRCRPTHRPTPQEILDNYQVSDAKTTNWPGDWDPLRFVVDQRVVTEKEAELLNGLGPFEMNAFKGIHDDAFIVADERSQRRPER